MLQYYVQQLVVHAAMLVAAVAAIFVFLQVQVLRLPPIGPFSIGVTCAITFVLSLGFVLVLFRWIFYAALVNETLSHPCNPNEEGDLSAYGFRMANEAQKYVRGKYPFVLKPAEYFRTPLRYDGLRRTFYRVVVWGGLALTITLVLRYVVFVLK